ncbi:chemotaxis protein methyltransferase CheR, partial [Geoalkalibacter ferrihydriticus]
LADHRAYCEFLFSPAGHAQELVHMIDVVTTNKGQKTRRRHDRE